MTKFLVIQKKDGLFISADKETICYDRNVLDFLFDGVKAVSTHKQGWFELKGFNELPKLVQKRAQDKLINTRFELKPEYTPTEILPKSFRLDELEKYENVYGLYDKISDTIVGELETVEAVFEVLYKKDDWEWIKTNYALKHSLLSEIEYHPDIINELAPCKLTSNQMFEIIRKHVKENINLKVAQITSDYDFHFAVKRKVMLVEPYQSKFNRGTSRRPKWVTNNIDSKTFEILNIQTKGGTYSGSSVPEEMVAANGKEMNEKVEKYLEDLMKEINKEYCDCLHCKGWGVVEK